jgi:uncharacterized repeat protein (TIGR01451 family)
MNFRLGPFVCLAALLSGCATSRNLQRIATVQNRAEALYSYAGAARFPMTSEIVEVSIYAPQATKHEYAVPAALQEKAAKPAVSEQTQSADAISKEQASATKTKESAAEVKEKPLESIERTDVQKETVVAKELAAKEVEKSQAAEIRQQTIASDTRVSEQQPTFHKRVSRERAMVGEKFEFVLEFQNSTPVDLASVQLTDPLDSRLKLFQDDIKVQPDLKHYVSVGNGQVIVRFLNELKRGQRVRIRVPVMFPVTSAAAAQ